MPRSRTIVLLGAQRNDPTLGAAVDEAGIQGKIAIITAGWQEREPEDGELVAHLQGRAVNLSLHARGEDVFRADPELAAAYHDRQQRLRQRQDFYRIRLEHALEADHVIRQRPEPASILEEESQASIAAVRALDEWHLARCAEIRDAFEAKWDVANRPAVARHRQEVAELVGPCEAIAFAGGHVASLVNRLTLFGIGPLAGERAIFAWSAGAMAIADRIVLFHDDPPQGPGASEVLDAGLGLVTGVVVFPAPERRLHLERRDRVAEMVHRFAPAACIALPARSYVHWTSGRAGMSEGVIRLADNKRRARTSRPLREKRPRHPKHSLAIEGFLAAQPDPAKAIAFMAARAFPIVEGTHVTFAWYGDAEAVKLVHWIYGLESQTPLSRVAGTDLFHLTLEIPENSRIEYKLEIHKAGKREWVKDPKNPHQAEDPFGANSVLQSDGYVEPPWTRFDPAARPGSLEPFVLRSKALDAEKRGHVYLPARFRRSRVYPLLVVHDGGDYIRYAAMKTVLDNLIHRLEIPEFIVAFTDPGDRLVEYANDERHARYLTEELVPDLAARLPLRDRPEARCLMGASFGAIAAFSTAARYGGFWGKLLLQSGSFAFTDIGQKNRRGPVFEQVVAFMNRYRADPRAVSEKVFVSCGVYESLIYENRSLVPLLSKTGMQVRFDEARDGHNWENWRDRLREGLSWLFPGPLMLIYE
jgi:enterochelin esterase family protein